jgi:DNA-binding beta-propeller fold protein YncE
MRIAAVAFAVVLIVTPAFSQRPSDPALLVPQNAPELDYVSVANALVVPAEMKMGAPASLGFDSKGHMFVLTRGAQALFEFDADGKFIRAFGDGLMTRAHGMKIDSDNNIWATDVGGHTVMKISPTGEILLTIGTKGQRGDWDEAAQSRKLNDPNDVAIGRNGDIFIVQGHVPGAMGDPRVLKFDKTGKFIKTWGGKGSEPGKFQVAHGIDIDAKGMLWVADRENSRFQTFDQDGKFIREVKIAGLPCSLSIGKQYIYTVNGFTGQILRMDLDGKVLAATGKPGKGLGEFGEAHFIAVSPKGDIWVADSVNANVQKFVKK